MVVLTLPTRKGAVMPAVASTEELLAVYRRSELFDAAKFARHFADGPLPDDPHDCAAKLVQAGLLTDYQATQLLRGKRKGFIVGSYKILEPIGRGGASTVFLAE